MSIYVTEIVGWVSAAVVVSVIVVCVCLATMRGADAFSADLAVCVQSGGDWAITPNSSSYQCTHNE